MLIVSTLPVILDPRAPIPNRLTELLIPVPLPGPTAEPLHLLDPRLRAQAKLPAQPREGLGEVLALGPRLDDVDSDRIRRICLALLPGAVEDVPRLHPHAPLQHGRRVAMLRLDDDRSRIAVGGPGGAAAVRAREVEQLFGPVFGGAAKVVVGGRAVEG